MYKFATRYRPSYLNQSINAEFGIEVFYSEESKTAIFYSGKAIKHLWFNSFSSVEMMMDKINTSIINIIANNRAKQERNDKAKALQAVLKAADHFKLGDIIVNSWGYEQTNVDFYQVVEILNKKIKARSLCQEAVEGSQGFMCCSVLPVKDSFSNEDILLLSIKINKWGDNDVVICNPKSHYYFRKWNGQKEYCSWYA